MIYGEFAGGVDRITNVNWKAPPDGNPCGPLPDPLCNTYTNQGSVPFLEGTFDTDRTYGANGSQGGIRSCLDGPCPDSFTLTGPQVAINAITLDINGNMVFTTLQLLNNPGNRLIWTVPMSSGEVCQTFGEGDSATSRPIPMVPESYTIEIDSTILDDVEFIEVGLGLSHPWSDGSTFCKQPPGPNIIFGAAGVYTYLPKWFDWTFGHITIGEGNQFDPSTGGPICLWFLSRRVPPGQDPGPWVVYDTFLRPQDTWTISATCIPEPSSRDAALHGFYTGAKGVFHKTAFGRPLGRPEPDRRSRFRR